MINFDPRYAWSFVDALEAGDEARAVQTAFALTGHEGVLDIADHDQELPETDEELAEQIREPLKTIHTAPSDVVWGVVIPMILGKMLAYLEHYDEVSE